MYNNTYWICRIQRKSIYKNKTFSTCLIQPHCYSCKQWSVHCGIPTGWLADVGCSSSHIVRYYDIFSRKTMTTAVFIALWQWDKGATVLEPQSKILPCLVIFHLKQPKIAVYTCLKTITKLGAKIYTAVTEDTNTDHCFQSLITINQQKWLWSFILSDLCMLSFPLRVVCYLTTRISFLHFALPKYRVYFCWAGWHFYLRTEIHMWI